MGAARDFLELINHKGLPLFNPLVGDSHVNNRQEYDNTGSGNLQPEKWNETAKQLYNVIMWLIILWNAKPDTPLFNFKDEVINPNHSYLSQLDVTYKTPDLMSHFLPPHEVSFTFCCSSIVFPR
ncbi:putative glutamine transport system permease protein [Streptococcus pneumoniae]|nr:putative glutamine transport system permease protein [Streptococcus pneumoniae]VKP54052.1 putative glutamine transport system permease protein [Streptococcus pneumoniae]